MNYCIVEIRGSGIEYVGFSGSLEACEARKAELLELQKAEAESAEEFSTVYRNGNLQPFSYEIWTEEEYLVDKYCDSVGSYEN